MKLGWPELDQLHALAVAAGQAIMQVYQSPVQAWTKSDNTPVTQADLRANDIICAGLARHFPGVHVVSEESLERHGPPPGAPAAECAAFFLVDPLDGTKEFIKRNGEFTVNIALVADGLPVAGVVLAPALGVCYLAANGLGGWKLQGGGRQALGVAKRQPGQPLRILGSRSHGADQLQGWIQALPVPHQLSSVGSSLKFCQVAEGGADIYPRFGPTSQWDTAAAHCVLQAAGGTVCVAGGQDLRYGLDRPILNPSFFAFGDPAVRQFVA